MTRRVFELAGIVSYGSAAILVISCGSSSLESDLNRMRDFGRAYLIAEAESKDLQYDLPAALAKLDEKTRDWVEKGRNSGRLQLFGKPYKYVGSIPILAAYQSGSRQLILFGDGRVEYGPPAATDGRLMGF